MSLPAGKPNLRHRLVRLRSPCLCDKDVQVADSSQRSATVRAGFRDGGRVHTITMTCLHDGVPDNVDAPAKEMSVSIDDVRVIHVTRLDYKFRGNQRFEADGVQVDVMWDLHGWVFGRPRRDAVFMFRPRVTGRHLWAEAALVTGEGLVKTGFTLLVHAFNGAVKGSIR